MHPGIRILTETTDVVSFRLESVDDFIASMHPTENLDEIAMFLAEREYMLHAVRHIWVCQPSVGE